MRKIDPLRFLFHTVRLAAAVGFGLLPVVFSRAALLESDQLPLSFADILDSPEEFVPDELVVMFRADTGRHAPQALDKGFAQLLADRDAAALDDLLRTHGVTQMRRVFRGFEDRNGKLRQTARQRAAEQRRKYPKRRAPAGPPRQIPALEDVFLLQLSRGEDVRQAAAAFERDERVVYAHPNYIYRLYAEPLPSLRFLPDDRYISEDGINWSEGAFGQTFPDLWGLRNIQSIEAWNEFDTNGNGKFSPSETRPSEGIVVAVIDTGLDATHPDISGNVWSNSAEIPGNGLDDDGNGFADDVNGWDFVNDDNLPADGSGHGTHVAGTIAAAGNNTLGVAGVALWAEIMPLKGLSDAGSGSATDLAAAINYAVDMGADILSNSWGGFSSSSAIEAAFDYAYSLGVLSIAAAGNSDGDIEDSTFPADYDSVMAVAASDEQDVRASFSNFGTPVDVTAPGVATLSLSANGSDNAIATQNPFVVVDTDYMWLNGTSMACPHVSGAAAVLMSQFPNESADEIRGRLRAGADDIDLQNPDFEVLLGSGRLNLLNSMLADPHPVLWPVSIVATGFIAGLDGTIDLTIENFWQAAQGAQAVLSTESPDVTVQNGTESLGELGIRESTTVSFVVAVDSAAPFGEIEFSLALTATGGYESSLVFRIPITFFQNASVDAQLPTSSLIVFHTVLQDYNADGSVDASLSDLALGHTLFENLGDGTFSEVASFAGGVGIAPVRVQLLLDIDRDGDDDLLLGGAAIGISSHLFLTNADGTLTEITDASGLPDLPLTALAATDLDNDGDIDIVAATNSFPALTTTLLLRNNGNNTFTDITSSSNLPSQLLPRQLGKIVLIDYDNDGDSDLLNSHSDPGRSMSLFRNDGNLEFTDVTAQSFPGGVRDRSSTLAAGDYDNDGDLDLFASHVVDCAAKPVVTQSSLYRNNGDGTFTDVIASTGELGGTSITSAFWGSEFFDFDNDGDLDLYISKDSTCAALEGLVTAKFQVLFENNGDGTFSRVNNLAFPPDTGSTLATAGFGDYDSDGAFDIYAPGTALAGGKGGLLRNVVNSGNNWIHVELEGDTSNRDAYGARVIVKTNGGSQIREVHSSAVDATTAHFGLGSSGMIDSIEVRWPSGIVQRLENVAVNQQLLIVECQDSDGDGVCNEVDNCAMDANPDQSDIDGDGLGDPCDLDMDGDGVENTSDICIERANPEQWDRDHDGCGNVCDGDFDQSGRVDVGDYDDLLRHFGDTWQQIPTEHELDNPAVSPVGYSDLAVFFELLFEVPVPGPSGTTRGTTACPAQ